MGQIRWYKRYPSDALQGMFALSLEERGAYNTVLDLIYDRDNHLPDDDRYLAGCMRCDIRVWRRIKSRLIELGKLTVIDGEIRNTKADEVVHEALGRGLSAREAGLASVRSRRAKSEQQSHKINKINGTTVSTDAQRPFELSQKLEDREERIPPKAPQGADAIDEDFAVWYARYPHKVGRGQAVRAYRTARRKASAQALLDGLDRYVRNKPADRPWCNPATWLNGERWLDEEPKPPQRVLGFGLVE